MVNVHPFTVEVPQHDLDELRERISNTRWPDEIDGAGWEYGANRSYMQELVEHWRDTFDWRVQEQFINGYANYRAPIDGMGIHFIHERGTGPNPLPLIITHGWPSSFYEMFKLMPLLTDPARHGASATDSFDVVIPSIPGYAFSDKPTQRGFNYRHVADLWVQLMEHLGYPRFGAHAYDVGASITSILLRSHPDRVIGYHTTEPSIPAPYLGPGSRELSQAEREHHAYQQRWMADEGGYMALQATRPQTVGYGLTDSPVGLAAWIIEKWYGWTAPPTGRLDAHFSKDELLTNVTLYWVTETINSANRLYYERAHHPTPLGPDERIRVPVGVALTTQQIERVPRESAERVFTDIRHWTDLGYGGHFVALEEPERVAESIRAFFRPLRDGG